MKQQKYIYEFATRSGMDGKELVETLNEKYTDKLLANVIELDYGYLVVWED
jgi:hypothetical protein